LIEIRVFAQLGSAAASPVTAFLIAGQASMLCRAAVPTTDLTLAKNSAP
jgi:hypothetical protein